MGKIQYLCTAILILKWRGRAQMDQNILVLINWDVKWTFKMKSWGKKVCLHRNWCELGSDLGKPLKFTGILHDNLGSWRKLSQGQKWTQFLSKEILTWVKKCLGTKPELTLEMEALELCRCTQVTEDLTPLQDWGGGLGSWGQKLPCTISPQPALRQALWTPLCSCHLLSGLGWSSFV